MKLDEERLLTDEGYIILARATYTKSKTWKALTPEQKVIMTTLLMKVNYKDGEQWDDVQKKFIPIRRGQTMTSLEKLRKECGKGISIKNIRTCLDKLEKMDFLENQSAKQYRLITIVNYDFYQLQENYTAKQPANVRQTSGKRPATNNKGNKDKQEKKEDIDLVAEFVEWWNLEFHQRLSPATYREKLKVRFETYSLEQMQDAARAMRQDGYMMGRNEFGRVYATLEYLSRNNPNVDKWLNTANARKQLEGGTSNGTAANRQPTPERIAHPGGETERLAERAKQLLANRQRADPALPS